MDTLVPTPVSTSYCEAVTRNLLESLDDRYLIHLPVLEPLLVSSAIAVEQMVEHGEIDPDLSLRMKDAGWLAINKIPIDVIDELEVSLIVEAACTWPDDVARSVESAKRVALDFYEGFWPFEHPAAVAQAARFGTLANHLPAPVFMADVDQRITFSSHELDILLDCSQGEVERQTMDELFDVRLNVGRNAKTAVEIVVDGSSRHLDVTVLTTETFAGTEYFGFVTDRTRERHLEQMRDGVVGAISHELRTPLTAVIGYLDLLVNGTLAENERQDALMIAKSEADLLLRLVSDIVDFSKLTVGTAVLAKDQFALLGVIESSARRASADHPSPPRIQIDISDTFVVHGDSDRIGQLFTNLFTNVRRYGGPNVEISGTANAEGWHITVRDDGPGIPPGDLDQILEPFVQGSRQHKGDGAGLGLAICAGIVTSHGGRLVVSNDGGARFDIFLPRRGRQVDRTP